MKKEDVGYWGKLLGVRESGSFAESVEGGERESISPGNGVNIGVLPVKIFFYHFRLGNNEFVL